jgi:murein DD-endopeptidase MepM/ murein hydrolase activator NlpD
VPLAAVLAAFGAGVVADGWLRTHGPPQPVQADARAEPTIAAAPYPVDSRPDTLGQPTMTAAPVAATTGRQSAMRLRVPIDGIDIGSFKSGFAEARGSRPHEAVDILAPRGTPVHAVQDGTIAKLFLSKAGGTTIYEFEAEGRICYYYAHLDRYANGLHDGQHVSQGEVIGYVGTSGNAPPGTPHLHFAIFELNPDRKWWQGRPIDPYLVFKGKN